MDSAPLRAEIERLRGEVAAWRGPAQEPVPGQYYVICDHVLEASHDLRDHDFVYKCIGPCATCPCHSQLVATSEWRVTHASPKYGTHFYKFEAPVDDPNPFHPPEVQDGERRGAIYYYLEKHELSTALCSSEFVDENGGVVERPDAQGTLDDPRWVWRCTMHDGEDEGA